MVMPSDPKLHQSLGAAGLARYWKLAPRRALSLHPRQAGVLLVAQGQAWATLQEPHPVRGKESGDHCLRAGQQLRVSAGQHLVIESLDGGPVYFDWTPSLSPRRLPRSRWNEAVVQPLRDLRQALWLAAGALVRLLIGLAGYGEFLVAGRGRVMTGHEANPP
jgi:hypothetical protein